MPWTADYAVNDGLHSLSFDLVGLQWGSRICISKKFLDVLILGSHFRNLSKLLVKYFVSYPLFVFSLITTAYTLKAQASVTNTRLMTSFSGGGNPNLEKCLPLVT